MKQVLMGLVLLMAGLSLAQGTDYRQAAVASAALARLQAVAQGATGEEKLLAWAKEVKARAEKSYEAKAYFKAAREAQAALFLFRAASGEPQVQARGPRPAPPYGDAPSLWTQGPCLCPRGVRGDRARVPALPRGPRGQWTGRRRSSPTTGPRIAW